MSATDSAPVTVLVSHPDRLLRLGLAALLRGQSDIRVADDDAGQAPVDVVVTSHEGALAHLHAMRGRGGRPATVRVLALCMQCKEHDVLVALQSGVLGYLLLACELAELLEGIRAVGQGRRYLCRSVAQCIADGMTRENLTAREADVLDLLAAGHCNKTIARHLNIAVGTVKVHMKGIMAKLDASSRTQALTIAVARGLVRETALAGAAA